MNAAANQVAEVASSVTDQALMQAITKAEIDQAIIAAHARPRSVKAFLDECMALATLNEAIADDCIYALPRKENGQTKMIEGPSARLAEIVMHAWGNCRSGARVVDEGRDFLTAQGIFQDLEKNVHITYEVRRRISGNRGRYSADMIGVTGNAACSIALRNAVFKGVPKAFWSPIYEAARKVVAGDSKTLANRRSEALAALQKLGATSDKVFAVLEVKGVEDITLEHLTLLRGLFVAIRDGEITVEEAFAPKQDTPAPTRADSVKDALRPGAGDPKPAAEQPKEEKRPDGKAEDLGGYIPQYDAATAIAEMKKTKAVKNLDAVYALIKLDFEKSKRELPDDVHSAYVFKKEDLEKV
jgi:hypothetical protein